MLGLGRGYFESTTSVHFSLWRLRGEPRHLLGPLLEIWALGYGLDLRLQDPQIPGLLLQYQVRGTQASAMGA